MKGNHIEESKKEGSKSSYLPTKLSLFIRAAVGVYLLYIVYTLRDVTQKYTGKELIFFLAAIVLFGVLGIFLCIHSARGLVTGRYEGGAMDSGSDREE